MHDRFEKIRFCTLYRSDLKNTMSLEMFEIVMAIGIFAWIRAVVHIFVKCCTIQHCVCIDRAVVLLALTEQQILREYEAGCYYDEKVFTAALNSPNDTRPVLCPICQK